MAGLQPLPGAAPHGRASPAGPVAGGSGRVACWLAFGLWAAAQAHAQTTAPASPAPERPTAAPAAASPDLASRDGAAAAGRGAPAGTVVVEDDRVRIEETRVRGQTVRVQVRSKVPGLGSYDIVVQPGRDNSTTPRGATGQRAWSVLSF